jgi:hypothetical protein
VTLALISTCEIVFETLHSTVLKRYLEDVKSFLQSLIAILEKLVHLTLAEELCELVPLLCLNEPMNFVKCSTCACQLWFR